MSLINGINWILTLSLPNRVNHFYVKRILQWIRPAQRKDFNFNNSVGIKLLTRLRLGFSHLGEHKLKHGVRDILNPLCSCNIEAETTTHYFPRCHSYNANRSALMNNLNEIDSFFSTLNDSKFINLILYFGKDHLKDICWSCLTLWTCLNKFWKCILFGDNIRFLYFLSRSVEIVAYFLRNWIN